MNLKITPLLGKRICIFGATGQVGRRLLSILAGADFPKEQLDLFSRDMTKISYLQSGSTSTLQTKSIYSADFDEYDVIFNCTPADVFKRYIGELWNEHCIVIDKSSAFRGDSEVPLVVPEVNWDSVGESRLICSPNCVAIPLAMVLNIILPHLDQVSYISVSTYQSVSGAGDNGLTALLDECKKSFFDPKVNPEYFEKQIVFNLLAKIGDFSEDMSTSEEDKIMEETGRILGKSLPIAVTAVRVPVLIGHCIALHICCSCKNLNNLVAALSEAEGIKLLPDETYITPIEAAHEDFVYVSRLRRTNSGIAMWIACDNLGKGAALNAIQIALKKLQ